MAEQNNEPQTARERDQLQQELAIASSIAENQARKPTETKTDNNENIATDDSNPAEIENDLGEQRGKDNKKPSVIEDATKKIEKQALKTGAKMAARSTGAAILTFLPEILVALFFIFLISLIIFATASVYMCAEKKGTLGVLWTTSFGTDFYPLLEESFNGTCIADTPAAPNSTNNPPVAKPTPAANVAPDTTAQ